MRWVGGMTEINKIIEALERRYNVKVVRLVVYGRDREGRMIRFAIP